MKRFKFRFESVEKIRRNREQQVLRLFGAALRDLERCKGYKETLRATLLKTQTEREQLAQTPTKPAEFAIVEAFIRGTERRIIQTQQAILRAEKALEKARRIYLLARQQLRAIELLREKHFDEWKREKNKKEQLRIDDMINMRSLRKEEEVA